MAKDKTKAAELTPDMLGVSSKRGRKPSGNAMSNAERQRKYRASHAPVMVGDTITATVERLAADFDLTQSEVTRSLLRFALCNRNWSKTGF